MPDPSKILANPVLHCSTGKGEVGAHSASASLVSERSGTVESPARLAASPAPRRRAPSTSAESAAASPREPERLGGILGRLMGKYAPAITGEIDLLGDAGLEMKEEMEGMA